jgi:predicted O-linked N-acetylglucosamine transferase (SPINDLY family)
MTPHGPGTQDSALLATATARHRAGDFREARRLYAEVLAESPTDADALYRSGLLELQQGDASSALALIEQAFLQRRNRGLPIEAKHEMGLGQTLAALGLHTRAEAAYGRVLALDPNCVDAHFARALVLQSLNQHTQAIVAYERTLELSPDHFAALNNLGNCLQRSGRIAEAVSAYSRALTLRPDAAGAMANLGTVLQAVGRTEEAVALLRGAMAREPQVTAHAVNLGIALCRHKDFAAAEATLRQAHDADPSSADAAFNLGNALAGLGQARAAGELYRRAIELRPGHVDALVNLGNMHREQGEFAAAGEAYAAAMGVDPHCVSALNNAGCLLRTLGRLDEAEDVLRQALQVAPDNATLHDNLGSVLKDAGDLRMAMACFRRSLELDPDNPATHGNLAYALCFSADAAAPIRAECERWGQRFGAALSPTMQVFANDRLPLRRLKVGYVSPDFRDHCQSLFTIPLLAAHDRAAVEVYCYSSVRRPDERTQQIAKLADHWRDVRLLSDARLAQIIGEDRIDVLVDLTMHMADGRLLTFARKPAPVQIAWLAYPGTTGLAAMDYRITDPRLDPPGCEQNYQEHSIHLPDSFWCYDPLNTELDVGPLPALQRGFVTFGCLNNPCKLSDATLRLWGRVMQAVANARLILLAPAGRHRTRLAERLAAHGIDGQRVDFVPYRTRALYLRCYEHIDLGLDTIPYNGHTTSLDALWMGVPTVTRVGNTCVGRGGLSQLTQVGLAELAATTDDTFIETAVSLSGDLKNLAALRVQLRGRLENSPLMDGRRFAGHMEAAYRFAWARWCSSQSID